MGGGGGRRHNYGLTKFTVYKMIFTIHRTITAYRELEEDGITQDMMNDKFLLGRRSSDESDEGNSTVHAYV